MKQVPKNMTLSKKFESFLKNEKNNGKDILK